MNQTATFTPRIALAMSTALVSVALAGCATSGAPPAHASLAKAQVALEKGQVGKAVAHAESAVLADPRNAQNRALLGAAYLEAGRFQSAATSFADALALGDTDPRTILSYALAETASGNSREAVTALENARADLDPADLGLALALAGDTGGGIDVLSEALRNGESTPKLRQNLAYAYALHGDWRAARIMAAEDVPADMVSDRIGEWAQLAAPEYFQHRVASLLQVNPVYDSGQPVQLALANFPSHGQMVADAAQAAGSPDLASASDPSSAGDEYTAGTGELAPAIDGRAQSPSFAAAFAQDYPATATPSMAPRGPIVQQLPTGYKEADAKKPAASKPRMAAASSQRRMAATADSSAGTHLVQLGSFSSRAGAERAWGIYQTRYPQLSGRDVVITQAVVGGKTYFRVAAAGYGARSASALCQTVKASGNGCIAHAASRPLPGAVDRGIRLASR